MSLNLAMTLTTLLMSLAFMQQSLEHLVDTTSSLRRLFGIRFLLCVGLIIGVWPQAICVMLLINSLIILNRYQGPYNGGSDRMGLLILSCVCLAYWMPSQSAQEYIFGYLAVQLVLSYFIAGWCKIMNPEWRSGLALQDVFQFSAYPVSERLRNLARRPVLLHVMSGGVIMFQLLFPLSLLTPVTVTLGLAISTLFHIANACVFGLNRFVWIWIAAYPSLIWLQSRLFGGG